MSDKFAFHQENCWFNGDYKFLLKSTISNWWKEISSVWLGQETYTQCKGKIFVCLLHHTLTFENYVYLKETVACDQILQWWQS